MPAIVRNTRLADIPRISELQHRIYPTIVPFSLEQFEEHLRVFAQGQLVAELDGAVVGASSSLIVMWDDYGLDHTWREVTGSGSFHTHNPQRRTLYGAEVFVYSSPRPSAARAWASLCTPRAAACAAN